MKKTFIIAATCLALSACVKTNQNQASKPTTQDSIVLVQGHKKPSPQPNNEILKSGKKESLAIESDYALEEPAAEPALHHHYMPTGSVSRGDNKMAPPTTDQEQPQGQNFNTEGYAYTPENDYKAVLTDPLSTFSIDVDAASYTNTRRFLNNGALPPVDAVRIEEFINYFSYSYEQPTTNDPFSINTEYAACPWNKNHQLLHLGLKGKSFDFNEIQAMNLVFLVDVSGSMSQQNKLPLLKKSFELLTKKLRAKDKISIVVYAGAAGLVLPATPGNNSEAILNAFNQLNAGGSTAGGEGINLAYKVAKENFIENGINRVILATDGDFNIGSSSDAEMTRLIEEKRKDDIFITVLGFGMGNYKDSKMETIADKGNGNYFYIDNLEEARKTLVTELDGTLNTIAKDVKIQIEFNPEKVKAYRLIGYVNRKLNNEDFNDDKKDAGELGAGHTVTALYEIIPAGSDEEIAYSVDDLRYQKPKTTANTNPSDEIATVKLRYKLPKGTESKLLVRAIPDQKKEPSSENFNFSASVAGFGMLLSKSNYANDMTYQDIINWATASKGIDTEGYRAEFIQLVKMAALLDEQTVMK